MSPCDPEPRSSEQSSEPPSSPSRPWLRPYLRPVLPQGAAPPWLMWAEPRNHGYLLREVGRRLGSQVPASNSRAQQGRGDVAGLPGGVLAFRGDRLWAHTSPTMEPGRNKGRSPEKAAEASSSGSAEGTMALSFLCHHLHASSSLPCRVALYARTPRRSQPQEMWSGAGPGKGANCPENRKERTEVTGRKPRPTAQDQHSSLRLACPGDSHTLRGERFAFGSSIQQCLDHMADPTPYIFPSAHDGPANE